MITLAHQNTYTNGRSFWYFTALIANAASNPNNPKQHCLIKNCAGFPPFGTYTHNPVLATIIMPNTSNMMKQSQMHMILKRGDIGVAYLESLSAAQSQLHAWTDTIRILESIELHKFLHRHFHLARYARKRFTALHRVDFLLIHC